MRAERDKRNRRLHEFIADEAAAIMDEWSERMRRALAPDAMSASDLRDSLPVFLHQLAAALAHEIDGATQTDHELQLPTKSPIAQEHGQQRVDLGFDAAAIVREYFGLRTCILDLAVAAGVPISAAEVEVLTRCIATGIADAVRAYADRRDQMMEQQASKHLAFLAHELRNSLGSVQLATMSMSKVPQLKNIRPFQVLQRNIDRIRQLIDQALVDARLKARAELFVERVDLQSIVTEIVSEGPAEEKGIRVTVSFEGPPGLQGDARLLHSALSNLIHNAVKFSREGGNVSIVGRAEENGVVVHIEDECGGLPEGTYEQIFNPFIQSGTNRSGFGLGLAIAKQAAEAHNGSIRVHNLPGKGCVFTLDLPREQP